MKIQKILKTKDLSQWETINTKKQYIKTKSQYLPKTLTLYYEDLNPFIVTKKHI